MLSLGRVLRVARLATAAVLASATLPLAGPGTALAAVELLPDMQMAAPYNLYVKVNAAGRQRLRFGTIVWNVGDGPLEVRANSRSGKVMTRVVQRVKTSTGSVPYLVPTASVFYSGDGHAHWHIARFISVTLGLPPGSETSTADPRRLRKIGFCLVDLVRAPAELRPPGSALRRGYGVSGCGDKTSTKLRMGVSVGWGDDYKPFFNHQMVDVTGLPAATYRLCATVNPEGLWLEKGDNITNNSYWLDILLDPAAATVSVVGQAATACDAAVP